MKKQHAASSELANGLQSAWERGLAPGLLLVAAIVAAYGPALWGTFIWDDDSWTFRLANLLKDLPGLWSIWTRPTAMQQYYPLSGSSFWLDYHLWGFWTMPYHVENILLHATSALLFCRLLQKLELPGAWLAAAIFALHPVMVESVAWITERKNVLSLALYLGALLAYGRFTSFWKSACPTAGPADHSSPATRAPAGSRGGDKRGRASGGSEYFFYGLALILFLASMLAKTTAVSLPAVILLLAWWKRGRLRWREDLKAALPFFALTVCLGMGTFWLERHHVGAQGPQWSLSFAQRCLVAGRDLWFYAGKLLWPANLCFIYPRWNLDPRSPLQWLYPAGAVGVLLGLWLARKRIGRGPATAAFFFAGTLFPVLGFMNAYFMIYSFVCDHWVYLSTLGPIALAAAGFARWTARMRSPALAQASAGVVLAWLAFLSWSQAGTFLNSEILFRTAIARNPNAAMAHNNLGMLLFQKGMREDDATARAEGIEHLRRALELQPKSAHAHNNLGNALLAGGQPREAMKQYQESLDLDPSNPDTCNNVASMLATSSDASLRNGAKAVELAQKANQLLGGRSPVALGTLAAAYAEAGNFPAAKTTVAEALRLVADNPESRLAQILMAQSNLYSSGLPFHEP